MAAPISSMFKYSIVCNILNSPPIFIKFVLKCMVCKVLFLEAQYALRLYSSLMVHMKKIQTKMNTSSVPVTIMGDMTFHIRRDSLGKITLVKVMRLQMSNVTLLSSKGTLQEVIHILLWMLVKQMENLQYNVLRLVNDSDHVIESKHIRYKNDILIEISSFLVYLNFSLVLLN